MWVALLVVLLLQGRLHVAVSGTEHQNPEDFQKHGGSRSLTQTDPMLLIPPPAVTQKTVIVCLPAEMKAGSNECNEAISKANSESLGIQLQCVSGGTVKGCLKMVKDGAAQVAKVPSSGALLGEKDYGLKVIATEFFNDDLGNSTAGYAVAVVNSEWCYTTHGGAPEASDLRDMKACFSGQATDGGWYTPLGYLMRNGGMGIVSNETDISDDAESALEYFKEICAPGYYSMAPKVSGGRLKSMCKLCDDDTCKVSNEWHGSEGALECGQKKGDVVFMQYPILDDSVGAGSLTSLDENENKDKNEKDEDDDKKENDDKAKEEEEEKRKEEDEKDKKEEEEKEKPEEVESDYEEDDALAYEPASYEDENNTFEIPSLPTNLLPELPTTGKKKRKLLQEEGLLANKFLFCPSESQRCQPIEAYKECNWGRVASQAFIGTSEFLESETGVFFQRLLEYASRSPDFMNAASKVGEDPYWLITPGTSSIKAFDGSASSTYDPGYIDSVKKSLAHAYSLGADPSAQDAKNDVEEEDSSGGLSTAAIIGISVAAGIVGISLVIAGIYWYTKRQKDSGWQQYQDAVKSISRI